MLKWNISLIFNVEQKYLHSFTGHLNIHKFARKHSVLFYFLFTFLQFVRI